jgi:AcrR family transcriptional regulator
MSPTASAGPGTRDGRIDGRTLRHQHRRPELVAALVEYVLDNGIADFALRPAASAVGVTHATLIRHFATKEELLTEVVDRVRADLVESVAADLEAHKSLGLPDLVWAVWDRMNEPHERRQFHLLYELAASHGRSGDNWIDLRASIPRELLPPLQLKLITDHGLSETEASTFAVLLIAQVRGLIINVIFDDDRVESDRAMRQFITMLVSAIGDRAPASS